MANRAVRRQQLKEPKPGKARSSARAMPSTGPRQAAPARTRGVGRFVPRFIMDIISELRKVVWPTREDVVHLTIVVVIVTVMIGAALGAIDIAFGKLIDEVLLKR